MYKRIQKEEQKEILGHPFWEESKARSKTPRFNKKDIPEEYFISAGALEHPNNREDFTLEQKINFAIFRFVIHFDYQSSLPLPSIKPPIKLKKFVFNKERMGYDVLVKSG